MQTKKIIADLLQTAISEHSSDLFILPKKTRYQLFLRTKQEMKFLKEVTVEQAKELINYFKYAAQMDISEHRRPQVGAMDYWLDGQNYYLRLSSLGDFDDLESLVIRIIYQLSESQYFFEKQFEQLADLTKKRGLIVTSGPTGSGKTTTMYELAKRIGRDKVVMTIEDPVEIHEESFLQTQVNNEAGINYVNLLKAALRHRPDILIIGEIRDQGTARLAIDAALSGHLVLATVHAKSTLQTISRLEGLGINNSELANCLTAVSYQRLIPVKNNLACLMDIADSEILQKNLIQKIRSEFVDWKDNLTLLRERGEIDNENYQLFKEG